MTGSLRRAATVCLVRVASAELEVLMVQRSPTARFMGGAWVFPGGVVELDDENRDAVVDSADGELAPWRAAAARELVEEVGIWLTTDGVLVDPLPSGDVAVDDKAVYSIAINTGRRFDGDGMAFFAHWITPSPLPVRFDTRFFAFAVPGGVDPVIDGNELVDDCWITPSDAIARDDRGEWLVAFPTRKTLEFFSDFPSPLELIEQVPPSASIPAIQPRLAVDESSVRILLPNDEGFDAAGAAERDPELLRRVLEVAGTGGIVPPELRRA